MRCIVSCTHALFCFLTHHLSFYLDKPHKANTDQHSKIKIVNIAALNSFMRHWLCAMTLAVIFVKGLPNVESKQESDANLIL